MSTSTDDLGPEFSSAATISSEDSSVLDNNAIPLRPKEKTDCDEEGHEGDST